MNKSDAVRKWLAQHPQATNAELYAAFPNMSRSMLRRLAASDESVRTARHLAPRGSLYESGAIHAEKEFRHKRWQVKVWRDFHSEHITIPLNSTVVRDMRAVFERARDLARQELPYAELVTYALVVQVTTSATIDRNGILVAKWGKDYRTRSMPLRHITVMQCWRAFADRELDRLDDVSISRARSILKTRAQDRNNSDPIMMRPARLSVYVHGPEEGERVVPSGAQA